jgi:hypothetical protein
VHRGLSTSLCYLRMFSDRFSGDRNARVLVLCAATRAFDNENPFFNDFTASAGHDDGHNVVLDDWCWGRRALR